MPVIAVAAATAGVLGAAGFSAGAAQPLDNAANTAQSASPSALSQQGNFLFKSAADRAADESADTAQLDARHSAVAASAVSTSVAAAKEPAKQISAAAAAAAVAKQRAAQREAALQAAAKQQVAQQAAQQVAKQQAAKAQAAKAQAAKEAAAKPKPPAAPPKPYLIYDSVSPGAIPAGKPAAVYSNGSYAASPRQVAGHHSVLWIDTNGSDPAANVLDVEPGDATPAGAAHWVKKRLTARPNEVAIVYTMRSEWRQVRAHVAELPSWMQSKVRYWIADPTGTPHVVPGSSATQWYWGKNYDVTTANPDFMR
jgi:hypothetical protein